MFYNSISSSESSTTDERMKKRKLALKRKKKIQKCMIYNLHTSYLHIRVNAYREAAQIVTALKFGYISTSSGETRRDNHSSMAVTQYQFSNVVVWESDFLYWTLVSINPDSDSLPTLWRWLWPPNFQGSFSCPGGNRWFMQLAFQILSESRNA